MFFRATKSLQLRLTGLTAITKHTKRRRPRRNIGGAERHDVRQPKCTSMPPARGKTTQPAPRRISRVAARRVFQRPGKGRHPVILTIGVPQRLPGSDWGCPVQITGLHRWLSRPRFVFGIDGLQALHLAMQFASATLETSGYELEWLGKKGDLGFPRFLPNLPKSRQDRLERIVEREVARFYAVVKRRTKRKKGTGRLGTSS